MSSNIAISVENLNKVYRIYRGRRDRIRQMFTKRKLYSEQWSLKNVNLTVQRGETVGIVGRNGAGKSTLLEIICGTTFPDSGKLEINGRIAALLELGAGFNPEFTGRENVYLNSRIFGMTKAEIDRRMKDILDFANIGEFIDQPVKTYSSGMYVRLAFAVAISVNPDILIVDEALAVGDDAFKRKCFARISQIRDGGGTILFVSHSAKMILELCDRAYLFDRGEVIMASTPKRVMAGYHKLIYAPPDKQDQLREEYLRTMVEGGCAKSQEGVASHCPTDSVPCDRDFFDENLVPQTTVEYERNGAIISNARILDMEGKQVNILRSGEEYICAYDIRFEMDAYKVRWGNMIKTTSGLLLGGITSHPRDSGRTKVRADDIVQVELPFCCRLTPDTYFLNVGVTGILDSEMVMLHRVEDVLMFRVQADDTLNFSGIVDFRLSSKNSDSA